MSDSNRGSRDTYTLYGTHGSHRRTSQPKPIHRRTLTAPAPTRHVTRTQHAPRTPSGACSPRLHKKAVGVTNDGILVDCFFSTHVFCSLNSTRSASGRRCAPRRPSLGRPRARSGLRAGLRNGMSTVAAREPRPDRLYVCRADFVHKTHSYKAPAQARGHAAQVSAE